jgi:acyl-CoA thioesterase
MSVAARCAASPFLRTLGVVPGDAAPDVVRLVLPVGATDVNRNGTLHGGAMASLLAAAAELAAGGQGDRTAPIDLAIVYLAVGRGGPVTAEGRVLRGGRAFAQAESTVLGPDGTPLARALAVVRRGALPDAVPVPEAPPRPEPLPDVAAPLSPFSARLGIGVARLAGGEAVARLTDGPAVRRADGAVAAGVLATLMDTVSGAAAWSRAGFDPRGRAATLGMHLVVHGALRGDDVVAEATALPAGSGCFACVTRCWGRRTGALVASGSATYRITRPA